LHLMFAGYDQKMRKRSRNDNASFPYVPKFGDYLHAA
jgi:hypothetical protein